MMPSLTELLESRFGLTRLASGLVYGLVSNMSFYLCCSHLTYIQKSVGGIAGLEPGLGCRSPSRKLGLLWWHFLVWPAHLVLKRFFGLRDEEHTGALRALLQKGLNMLGWCGESGEDVEQL